MLTKEERWVLTKALRNSSIKIEELLAEKHTIGVFEESLKEEIELINSIRKKLAL